LNSLDFYLWGYLKPLVQAGPLNDEEAIHHRTVYSCQTIRNCPNISEPVWRSVMRRAKAWFESHRGHFQKCITNK
jgi:hypothetical protein